MSDSILQEILYEEAIHSFLFAFKSCLFSTKVVKAISWLNVNRVQNKLINLLSVLNTRLIYFYRTESGALYMPWILSGEQNNDDSIWKQGKIAYSSSGSVKVCHDNMSFMTR